MAKKKDDPKPLPRGQRKEMLAASPHRPKLLSLRKDRDQARQRLTEAEADLRTTEGTADIDLDTVSRSRRAAAEANVEAAEAALPALRKQAARLKKDFEDADAEVTAFEDTILGESANLAPGDKRKQKFATNRDVFVDDLSGQRVRMAEGTKFTVTLSPVMLTARATIAVPNPVPVFGGRYEVESSDVDVLPGCLTSLVRNTSWVEPIGPPRPVAVEAVETA